MRYLSVLLALLLLLMTAIPVSASHNNLIVYRGSTGGGISCDSSTLQDSNLANGIPGTPSGSCNSTWNNNISSIRLTLHSDRCLKLFYDSGWTGAYYYFLGPRTGLINLPSQIDNQTSSFRIGFRGAPPNEHICY